MRLAHGTHSKNSAIAQLAEQPPCKRQVSGSNPDGGTNNNSEAAMIDWQHVMTCLKNRCTYKHISRATGIDTGTLSRLKSGKQDDIMAKPALMLLDVARDLLTDDEWKGVLVEDKQNEDAA